MPECTVYARRLQSATVQQVCKCNVGSCSICGSKCCQSMCTCDGIEPSEALSRSRGGYRCQVTALAIKRKRNEVGTKTSKPLVTKKKKYNPHSKKLGVIRDVKESRSSMRLRKQIQEEKHDSDSDYVNKPVRPTRKIATREATSKSKKTDENHDADDVNVDDNTLATLSINKDNSTVTASIVDDDEYVPSNDDFTLDINTVGCSIMDDDDDDISLAIAQKIINSRPPPIKETNEPMSRTRKKPSTTTTTNENTRIGMPYFMYGCLIMK